MNNDFEADLRRLFAQTQNLDQDPAEDPAFTDQVVRRVKRVKRASRVKFILLAVAAGLILALLTPWLGRFLQLAASGGTDLAQVAMTLLLSPAGWAIGGTGALLVFLKARP